MSLVFGVMFLCWHISSSSSRFSSVSFVSPHPDRSCGGVGDVEGVVAEGTIERADGDFFFGDEELLEAFGVEGALLSTTRVSAPYEYFYNEHTRFLFQAIVFIDTSGRL